MASKPRIKVRVGKLAEPLTIVSTFKGNKLGKFLEEQELSGDGIRVNGESKPLGYVLKQSDIITVVSHVSGGR